MKRAFFYLVLLIVCVLLLLFGSTNPVWTNILLTIVGTIVGLFIPLIADNLNRLYYWVIAIRFSNTLIRVSISYLFRIKVDSKYLLIRSARFPHYQPVGGVFKRYVTSDGFLTSLHILDDDLVPIDQTSKDDLRVRIKGWNIVELIKWFDSGKDREVSVWREFQQELIEPGYLPQELFPYIDCRYLERYVRPIRYSDFAKSNELIIAELYELLPTTDQAQFLREMMNRENDAWIWVDADRIQRQGAVPGQTLTAKISEHTKWIL